MLPRGHPHRATGGSPRRRAFAPPSPQLSVASRSACRRRNKVDLAAAVAAFEAAGSRGLHLAEWAADVERCATRAGFLLAGDLEVVATRRSGASRGRCSSPRRRSPICSAFAVSDEHHALRESLGIAIQP